VRDSAESEKVYYVCLAALLLAGLYLSSLYSYLLFHTLIEFSTCAIGFTLFILVWNTRSFLANDCLKLLGIGYAASALIDLIHTLAYKGMQVFPGYGANLPTQLWIAARYLQAATLSVAPLFVSHRLRPGALLAAYCLAVPLLLALIVSGRFPDCFVEGRGLTPFKIASEYLISGVLGAAMYFFHRVRRSFDRRVYFLVISSIACTMLAELSFTAYLSVYGFANMLGHLWKLAAFYLLYRALLTTGFREPYRLIFRDLKKAQEALLAAREGLEGTVERRTAELRASEEKYRALVQKIQVGVVVHGADGEVLIGNLLAQRLLGLNGHGTARGEGTLRREDGSPLPQEELPANRVLASGQPLRGTVLGVSPADGSGDAWVLVSADPVADARGRVSEVIVTFVDITARKKAEQALSRLNRELKAISDCNQVLMRASDERTLLSEICRIICDGAGYRMSWVGFAENDPEKTVRVVAWSGVDDGYLAEGGFTWADVERGRGPTGTSIRTGQSVCCQDFTSEAQIAPWRKAALERGYRSCISLPLKDEAAASFGVLTIYSTEPRAFDPDEVRLLEELAGDLAFGISVLRTRTERSLAEKALVRFNEELEQRVKERTTQLQEKNRELERMNKLFVGRELRMVELKERLRLLENAPAGGKP